MCRRKSEIFRGAAEGLALSADSDKLRACSSVAVRAACLGTRTCPGASPLESLRKAKIVKDDAPSCKRRG